RPVARIPASVPTGKGGASGISVRGVTPFTTRPRRGRIKEIRPTPVPSRTTQYSRDRRTFDRQVGGAGGFGSTGLGRSDHRAFGYSRLRLGDPAGFGTSAEWPGTPRPQGGVRCCLANLDNSARSDAL